MQSDPLLSLSRPTRHTLHSLSPAQLQRSDTVALVATWHPVMATLSLYESNSLHVLQPLEKAEQLQGKQDGGGMRTPHKGTKEASAAQTSA